MPKKQRRSELFTGAAVRRSLVGGFARGSTRPRGEQLAGAVLGQSFVAAVAQAFWVFGLLAATAE